MRLIVNATPYRDPPGGAGLRTRSLIQALQARMSVEVVWCASQDSPLDLAPPGAEVRVLPVQARRRWRRFLGLRLPEDGDALLTDHYPVAPIPTLVSVHDFGGSRIRRSLIRHCARQAAAVLAVSEAVGRTLPGNVVVVPNGVDLPADLPAPPEGDYVLFSDPALAHKGARTARAAARRAGVRLLEVGRGVEWLPRERMLAAVAGARAVICPSWTEGFGLLPLEGLALGTPVVVSDIPAHREVCGDAALYAPPGDAAEFASQLRRALAADEGRRERGRERAVGYTWDAAAERLAAVLDRLA